MINKVMSVYVLSTIWKREFTLMQESRRYHARGMNGTSSSPSSSSSAAAAVVFAVCVLLYRLTAAAGTYVVCQITCRTLSRLGCSPATLVSTIILGIYRRRMSKQLQTLKRAPVVRVRRALVFTIIAILLSVFFSWRHTAQTTWLTWAP